MTVAPGPRLPAQLFYGVFLLSGAAGLIFELLWFRLAGLVFGSTVWAATAVLSAFMAGLALGNGLGGYMAQRLRNPLHGYALAECLVAALGLTLVFALPALGPVLAPLSSPLLEAGGGTTLQWLRFACAFLLMLVPTTAMGLTLPLMVKALHGLQSHGPVISHLYGWNTVGAAGGILLTETLLLSTAGVTGSAVLATLLCLLAAFIAWRLSPLMARPEPAGPSTPNKETGTVYLRSSLAAVLAGALMLGLEVIWFRLLLLHTRGTATAFAVMLAIVLIGIALGGLLAGGWLRRHPATQGLAFTLAAGCALSVPLGYLALNLPLDIWWRAVIMMAPCALLSGALLPVLAAHLADRNGQAPAATGRLWLMNTAGGAAGAAFTGLVLLPGAGMEASLLMLGLAYVAVAICLLPEQRRGLTATACLLLMAGYWLFPQGWIQRHLEAATAIYRQMDDSRVVARREGLNETVQLLERQLFGEPFSYRLVTDGYSMSGTERDSRRYMSLFAWLPQSLHPAPESALLISYGVGTTARSLLNDPVLKSLDVVDLSPDVLAMSPLIHGPDDPLQDERVQVYVEDGRQFLLLTDRRFDLITAEPPPPRMKGVVNLYTREYFQLIHERLQPGGYSSYWLPVDQLSMDSTHAILAAFCQVFSDCSLWAGSNYNWIMLGSRQMPRPLPARQLTRLWQQSSSQPRLAALGLEQPALLGTTFLADAEQLGVWYADAAPLTDRWPRRLAERQASDGELQAYARWADSIEAQQRFAQSLWVRETLPPAYRQRALARFDLQPILNNELRPGPARHLPLVHRLLQSSELRTPVYWLLDSGMAEQQLIDRLLADGYRSDFAYHLGVRALLQGNFNAAASLFQDALANDDQRAFGPVVYSLCRLGELEAAQDLVDSQAVNLPFKCWPEG